MRFWVSLSFRLRSCSGAEIDDTRKLSEQLIHHWRKDAVKGNAKAQYLLAGQYFHGRFIDKDRVEAAKWYLKAAEQGFAMAQFVIAQCYDFGEGVTEDHVEAVKWYRKLADQGDARGQYQLGGKYCNGEGVPKDDTLAYMWWNLAAAQGDNGAKRYKALISERMTKEQITEAQKLSREWLAKHAKP